MNLDQLCAALGITTDQLIALLRNLVNESALNQIDLKKQAIIAERAKAMEPYNQQIADLEKEKAVRVAEITAAAK